MRYSLWSSTCTWLRVSLRAMMVFGCACVGAMAVGARGQCIEAVLESPDAFPPEQFGFAVAINGEWALVGETNAGSGTVRCFQRQDTTGKWNFVSELSPSEPNDIVEFGTRIDISGHVAVVEAHSAFPDGPAEVRVFRLDLESNQWREEARLPLIVGSDSYDSLGALAVSGDVIAVGPTLYFSQSPDRVIVFRYSSSTQTWSLDDAFMPMDYGVNDRFATSVDVSGDWIVTTTLHNSHSYDPITGTAHWFKYHAIDGIWREHQRTKFEADWSFVADVAIDGNVTALGLMDWERFGSRDAIMYRLDPDTGLWGFEDALLASSGAFPAWWATSWLDVAHGIVAVGDTQDDFGRTLVGSVFIYRYDPSALRWSHEVTLKDPDDAKKSSYSMNVAIHNDQIIVASPLFYSRPQPDSSGRAYIYNLAGLDCNANEWCDGPEVAGGISPDENANGVPDECDVLPGDANGDAAIDLTDLMLVINAWGVCDESANCPGDVAPWPVGDGVVGIADLLLILGHWRS